MSAEYVKLSQRDYDDEELAIGDGGKRRDGSLSPLESTTIPLSAVHRHDVLLDGEGDEDLEEVVLNPHSLAVSFQKINANINSNDNSNSNSYSNTNSNSNLSSSSSSSSPRRYPRNAMIRNDFPSAISRIPTSPRDWVFGCAFFIHFTGVLLLSFIEKVSLHHSSRNYQHIGSWSSIIMIVTLLGSFLGSITSIYELRQDDKSVILSYSLPVALVMKIVLGNILLIMRSMYSWIGCFVFMSALWDFVRYKHAKLSLSFTATVMDMVSKVFLTYGTSMTIFCVLVVCMQTCVLLWWGAFFAGLIGTIDTEYIVPVSIMMLFSLYWITEVFHQLMSFVVGGCTLWLFVRHDSSAPHSSSMLLDEVNALERPNNLEERQALTKKLILYAQCALSSSFGSISKAALIIPISHFFIQLRYSMLQRHRQVQSTWFCCCIPWAYFDYLCGGGGTATSLGPNSASVRCCRLQKYHRLSMPLLAVYGRTLSRTAEDQMTYHPETVATSMEDSTAYTIQGLSTTAAAICSVLFALTADSKEGSTWPLFLIVCFIVFYCGFSLSLYVFPSCVDALIVAAAMNPERFAKENQLVLLRFFRTSEIEMG